VPAVLLPPFSVARARTVDVITMVAQNLESARQATPRRLLKPLQRNAAGRVLHCVQVPTRASTTLVQLHGRSPIPENFHNLCELE
jgi:hypothetical protein